MISLIIPPGEQLAKTQKKLIEEYGKASSIKSQANRQAVEEVIRSTRKRLTLYSKTPKNGLVIYCGHVLSEDGRTRKKRIIDFEPFKPIKCSLYYCGKQFNIEPLRELLDDGVKFGFIVMNGEGTIFAILQGNTKTICHTMKVHLPNKQDRGGSSASRFARNREIVRHDYLRKVTEIAARVFIVDNKVNVAGLVLAGPADFKTRLFQSDLLDPRLAKKVIKIVDVAYGFEAGLNQAITLAAGSLGNLKYVQDQKLISKFFEEVKVDSPTITFGVKDTMKRLEMFLLKQLIVWEDIDYTRILVKTPKPNEYEAVVYLQGHMFEELKTYKDPKTGIDCEIIEAVGLNEWLIENHKRLGVELHFISDKSQEGFQFVQGFGGCAGFLRYALPAFEVPTFNEKAGGDFDPETDFI